nr:hypothetical protein Iba_chr01cCG8040 [Ipomoea batatas]
MGNSSEDNSILKGRALKDLSMVKLLLMRFLCKPRPPVQEGKFPDISLYDKSLFSRFWLFCAGKEPVNLLLPRNKFWSELRLKS